MSSSSALRIAFRAWAEPPRLPALQLLALWAMGVAQPLYDLLGRNPTLFVHDRAQPLDFFCFVLLLSLALPAAALVAPAEAARLLGRRASSAVYTLGMALLLALSLVPVIGKLTPLAGWVQLLAAVLLAILLAALWLAVRPLQQFLLLLSPAILLLPLIFLLRGGIREQWLRPGVEFDEASAEARTVVLLVLDALPLTSLLDDAGRIDPVRYPNFARLTATATWYRRARATAPNTELAVPTILSGQCSEAGRPPTFAGYPRNLFTLLGASYRTEALERVTELCPPSLCGEESAPFGQRFRLLTSDVAVVFAHWALPRGWTGRLPSIDAAWGGFLEAAGPTPRDSRPKKLIQVERFREQLERIEPGDGRLVFFSHLLLPHNPFFYLPSGRRYRTDHREPGGATSAFSDDPWLVGHSYQRHLLQLGFTDRLLGELIDALERAGRWEDALVVVTADHGASFRANLPRRKPQAANAVDILSVPLIVKGPGQRQGEVVDLPVQGLDVLPLMAEALGIPKPAWAEGLNREEHEAGSRPPVWCPTLPEALGAEIGAERVRQRVAEKLALFGSGESAGEIPAVGPRPDLLGTATEPPCGPPAPFQIKFDETPFRAMDGSSDFVPAELVGRVSGIDPGQAVDLAVAVNGTVRATTTSYRDGAANASLWVAIVPESAFRDGANRVEVFAVNEPGSRCPLSPTQAASESVRYLGARLGLTQVPGVMVRGLQRISLHDQKRIRWTRGRTRLVVPMAPEEAARLRELRVDIAGLAAEVLELRILVNGRLLFEGKVTEGPWSTTLPVPRSTTPVTIVLESNTVLHRGRTFGFALEGIWLGDGSQELGR